MRRTATALAAIGLGLSALVGVAGTASATPADNCTAFGCDGDTLKPGLPGLGDGFGGGVDVGAQAVKDGGQLSRVYKATCEQGGGTAERLYLTWKSAPEGVCRGGKYDKHLIPNMDK